MGQWIAMSKSQHKRVPDSKPQAKRHLCVKFAPFPQSLCVTGHVTLHRRSGLENG